MLPNDYATRVLLPEWLLSQKISDSDDCFIAEVESYLIRYPNYQLIYVENPFAICDRLIEREEDSKKQRGKGRGK